MTQADPFVFPRFKGEGRRGPPPILPALPRPGKNHPAIGPATKGSNGAMRHRADKCPGMRIENAPARRVGAALACPLTGHISKGRAKGVYGINAPVLGIRAAVGEGK
jgi:hypothetical protein